MNIPSWSDWSSKSWSFIRSDYASPDFGHAGGERAVAAIIAIIAINAVTEALKRPWEEAAHSSLQSRDVSMFSLLRLRYVLSKRTGCGRKRPGVA